MTNLEFLAMVAKVDSELAIALAKDSVENPQGKGSITNNFNQGCGVTTVYTGCTIFEGGAKKAGKKPAKGETKPSGQTPGTPLPPGGAEPLVAPPANSEEAVDAEEEDVDEDAEDADDSPPSPPVDTASTNADEISAPNLVL